MEGLRKAWIVNRPKINRQLLPIKLHYTLFWCGVGSCLIYVPLVAKRIGINASTIGVIYTLISLSNLFSQPCFGALSDRFQNARNVTMVLVVISAITLQSLLYIPPMQQIITKRHITLNCAKGNATVQQLISHSTACITFTLRSNETCSYMYSFPKYVNSGELNEISTVFQTTNETQTLNFEISSPMNFSDYPNCSHHHVHKCIHDMLNLTFSTPSTNTCITEDEYSEVNIYKTYQSWIFLILAIISHTAVYTCFTVTDAMCYQILGKDVEKFGHQRLWSTCSYGVASFVAGYFNDLASAEQTLPNYSIGFYVMLVTYFLDLTVLSKMPVTKVLLAKFSLKDVGKVLISFEIIIFTIGVFLIGVLTSLVWNYQFWFLESIGASQTLLGLTALLQCLVANALFFLVSGKIVRTLGNFYCLIFTFLAFSIRFAFYFVLKNPWHMLPVEILDGVTFSLFYVTLTSFAKINAPLGMEATMVGLFVSMFEGLGIAVGSLLTGIGFDYLGVRLSFLIGSIASAICTVIFLIIKLTNKDI